MNFDFKKILPIVIPVIILMALGGGYLYSQIQKDAGKPQAGAEDVRNLVSEVGKLIALPEGEDPTIATVTDINKLKDQPFFQKAKNGDKVLIYSVAKKAILYDPILKKVLDVAPVNIGSPSAETAPFLGEDK